MKPWTEFVLNEVLKERRRQNKKWGEQNHDSYHWLAILGEEFGELSQDSGCFYVICKKCNTEGSKVTIEKNELEHILNIHDLAIQKWNQRPYDYDMPAIVKKVQQLEKENEQLKKMLELGVNYERANS